MLEEGENLIWAVSYSDLLMVLMSFFVLFFSMDEKKTSSVLMQISTSMEKVGDKQQTGAAQTAAPQAGRSPQTAEAGSADSTSARKSLAAAFIGLKSDLNVVVNEGPEAESMVIWLPDNIFKTRQFELNNESREILDKILETAYQYKDKIVITFIGHSDPRRMKNTTKTLTDNFALSALRASRALAYAQSKGFQPKSLYVQGTADNDRASRTLSVKIQARELP